MKILKAKCLHGGRDPAFNINGYFLPCCWVDNRDALPIFEYYGFFDEALHIDNLKTPEDVKNVFKSPEWLTFFDIVDNHQELAPDICKQKCKLINGKENRSTEKINELGKNVGSPDYRLLDLIDVT